MLNLKVTWHVTYMWFGIVVKVKNISKRPTLTFTLNGQCPMLNLFCKFLDQSFKLYFTQTAKIIYFMASQALLFGSLEEMITDLFSNECSVGPIIREPHNEGVSEAPGLDQLL